MKIGLNEAGCLKLAIDQLYDTDHGRVLIKLLENMAGEFAPTYNPESSTSITLAAGRTEMMQTIRNLHRLTDEQIVIAFEEGNGL